MPFVALLSGVDVPPRFWTIGSWCLSQSRASKEGHTHNTLEQPIAFFAANQEGAPAQWKGNRGAASKRRPHETGGHRPNAGKGPGGRRRTRRENGGAGFLKKMVPRIFLPGTMSHAKKDPVHEDILARIELRFKKQGLNSTRLKYRPATRAEATN